MLENGYVGVITLQSDEKIKEYKYFEPKYFNNNTSHRLTTGYFVKVSGMLLFVNYRYAIKVTDNSA